MREGARGNDAERVVTQRELTELRGAVELVEGLRRPKQALDGEAVIEIAPGLTATLAIKRFEDLIRATRLYQDLKKSLDDPSRFDDLRGEVRDALFKSITEEAARRGAEIRQTQTVIQNLRLSLAMRIDEVTAAVEQAAAGVRETAFASAETNRAQAGKITQIEASLGNFYQDGRPGRVKLEQQMTVTADRVEGLRGQYTFKIQAGGALAGYGLAASEKNGVPDSAFIIAANKFAIVNPATYTGGLTNTPDVSHIPFGVDSSGIYLNHNVYVRGTMRIDGGTRTLADGMRGSVTISGSGGSWNDNAARQAVWTAIGKGGSPSTNNHLVIGDTVTIGGTTLMWDGSRWSNPGLALNGNLLVSGSVAADKIDSRGLTIRDNYGNVILGAGSGLDAGWVNGLGQLARQNSVASGQVTGLGTLATQNSVSRTQVTGLGALAAQDRVSSGQVTGLGTMATRDFAAINDTVRFPDGSVMNTWDFVSRLSRISSGNISAFMESAAIGNAYIGNAAVDTLKIAGNAVTVPSVFSAYGSGAGGWVYMDAPGLVIATGSINYIATTGGQASVGASINGQGSVSISLGDGFSGALTATAAFYVGAGNHYFQVNPTHPASRSIGWSTLVVMGAKR